MIFKNSGEDSSSKSGNLSGNFPQVLKNGQVKLSSKKYKPEKINLFKFEVQLKVNGLGFHDQILLAVFKYNQFRE